MPVTKLLTTLFILGLLNISFAADAPVPPSIAKGAPVKNNTDTNEVPPTLPEDPSSDSRNIPQPEVRIIKRKDAVIEEYRVNNQLRYVKITPKNGKPYYLADTDGDGVLETQENDLDNPPINQWILMEW